MHLSKLNQNVEAAVAKDRDGNQHVMVEKKADLLAKAWRKLVNICVRRDRLRTNAQASIEISLVCLHEKVVPHLVPTPGVQVELTNRFLEGGW